MRQVFVYQAFDWEEIVSIDVIAIWTDMVHLRYRYWAGGLVPG